MGAHVIVIGNEKGGSGKSTTAMHVIVGLLGLGLKVASIDLDVRQGSLTRYISNRHNYAKKQGIRLPMPKHALMKRDPNLSIRDAEEQEVNLLTGWIEPVLQSHDVVLMDTPGNDTPLSRLGHTYADTLVTPLNDSFVDLDVLAHIDGESLEIEEPSHYADLIWQQKLHRAKKGKKVLDWIVLRNRLSNLDSINRREMERLLSQLSKRLGFREVPGFNERVIYRELFPKGLTMMDLASLPQEAGGLSISHIKARQEVRNLLGALNLPFNVTGADTLKSA